MNLNITPEQRNQIVWALRALAASLEDPCSAERDTRTEDEVNDEMADLRDLADAITEVEPSAEET